ncbi:MAG: hypothetical protein ACRCY8_19880, partial [Dermatophilaceae bacterium]
MTSSARAGPVERVPRSEAPGAGRWARRGLMAGLAVVVVAAVIPAVVGVDVRAGSAPPLYADWDWRAGPATLVALLVVVAVAWPGGRALLDRMPWGRLLLLSWGAALVWM